MTEMFGEAWPPMSVPDLAPDDDDDPWRDGVPIIPVTVKVTELLSFFRLNSKR